MRGVKWSEAGSEDQRCEAPENAHYERALAKLFAHGALRHPPAHSSRRTSGAAIVSDVDPGDVVTLKLERLAGFGVDQYSA
jgi:hypothetical protein